MATCVYAVYDPVAHRIIVANAGHPPPVLLHLDGRAEVLRVPAGRADRRGRGATSRRWSWTRPAGATLLLYTDGLVESRPGTCGPASSSCGSGWRAVRLTGSITRRRWKPLCDEVLDMLGPGDRDDDIALLAARFDGIAPSDVAYWFLEPQHADPGARPAAGAAGAGPLGSGGPVGRGGAAGQRDRDQRGAVRRTARHAAAAADRRAALRGRRRRAAAAPACGSAGIQDEGGRGLFLVNRLAQRWGATRLSAGKVVWFELPLP